MDEPIESFDHQGITVNIYPDEDPHNPRDDDGWLGEMVCFHGRYNLGDKDASRRYDPHDYSGWDALEETVVGKRDIALPLYLYDHSGLRMKVGPFQGLLPQGHAEFDSGQVGWIVARPDAIRQQFGVGWRRDREAQQQLTEKVCKRLASEVEVYDSYISGDCYGYVLVDQEGNTLDSCFGYIGIKDVRAEAKQAAEHAAGHLAASYSV